MVWSVFGVPTQRCHRNLGPWKTHFRHISGCKCWLNQRFHRTKTRLFFSRFVINTKNKSILKCLATTERWLFFPLMDISSKLNMYVALWLHCYCRVE
jgi:hypothetical protein